MPERQEGFYWAKRGRWAEWEVVHWDSRRSLFSGCGFEQSMTEGEFEEIKEERLEP
ncbi:MAG: hypothetical protein KAS30_01640 [Candidatus Diapherotrites archaeon]|nr:hypothetical protein [Candidatus Diapherotrites archaeon]